MTTIAVSRQCMAADSKVTMSDGSSYHSVKLKKLAGEIFGFAGDTAHCFKWWKWYQLGMPIETPSIGEKEFDAQILMLNAKGIWLFCDFCEADLLKDDHFAIGAGAMSALTSLANGKTPEEAVRMACKINSANTGGEIDVMHLRAPRARR